MICRTRQWLPIIILGLVPACGGGDLVLPNDGGLASIRVVDGDGQRGSVGEVLDAPVVVEVTDPSGNPVEGVTVTFALTSAGDGAEVSPATAKTGADGRTEAHILLGDKIGLQTGEAAITGNAVPQSKATFSAVATAATSPPPPPSPPPPEENGPPRADFHADCHESVCTFEDTSGDDDGTVVSWSWSFGDGGTSSERNPTHLYPSDGHFEASLTVTDDDGAGNTKTHRIHVKKH